MHLGEESLIFGLDWARIHFIENPGMAFGMTFGGDTGKLILSLFRIVMVGFLIYYLRMLLKVKVGLGIVVGISLILAGAIGNIIDSAVYGLIFSETFHGGGVAQYVGFGNGYGSFLHGKVVDMFFFPLFSGHYPDGLPFLGGKPFLFFRPVFNVADSAITVGIFYMLLFHRNFIAGDNNVLDSKEAEVKVEE